MRELNNYSLEGEESERLTFRKLKESDFDKWMKFCLDPDSLRYIFPSDDKSPEEKCRIWFDRISNRYQNNLGGLNALIDKASGNFAGQCGLLIQDIDGVEELEIGYSLMPDFRGKGYAIEAAMKCRDLAFENDFRDSLISIIHVENQPSAAVAIKNGMSIDRTTIYGGNPVNIFRISKKQWQELKANR